MAARVLRPMFLAGALLLASAGPSVSVVACPPSTVRTLTDDIAEANLVLFGTLVDVQPDPNSADQRSTDLCIEVVLKGSEILGDRRVLALSRYVPLTNPNPKFLVFCGVVKDQIDPYRGVPVKADGDTLRYLQRALAIKGKPIAQKLRFFFDYLDNPDPEISLDAYHEFARTSYAEYREMAKNLPAHRIARWLQDSDTPFYRLGLYALLLGHCGKENDAPLLRKFLDGTCWLPSRPGMNEFLVGYTMLKPQEGWDYLRGILNNPIEDFYFRYQALRAVRLLWDSQPLVVDREELLKGMCQLLQQSDIADLAIEDLRKWGRWELAPRVLYLYQQQSHNVPVVRRSIVRYALSCPCPQAAAFLDGARAKEPGMVKDVEELLKLESENAEPAIPK